MGKTHLMRVEVGWGDDGRLEARPAGRQMSDISSPDAAANALAIVPDGDGYGEGDRLEAIVFGPIGRLVP